MSRVKIGFVGVGGMGQCAHLKNYASIPECEVVAIAEIRQELARKVAAKYGVERVYPDHTTMLASEKLDGIVASQPYSRHGVLLPDLFKAGVPVITEKPLTCSMEAGERILAALHSSKAVHYVGYHKRSDPATMYAVNEIARLKATGELGKLKYVRLLMPAGDWVANGFLDLVHSHDTMPALKHDPPPGDMGPETQREYDSFVNYYIHQVNLLRHLFGENYAVSYADPAGILLVAHSASGVPGTIEMSPYCTTIDWQESALIAFERGYVQIELPAPLASNRPGQATVYRDPGNGVTPEKIVPQLPWVHAMRQQAVNFIKAIQGEPTPLCQAAEAFDDLKIARDYIIALKGPLSA
jgi:predicted dehydrogenase